MKKNLKIGMRVEIGEPAATPARIDISDALDAMQAIFAARDCPDLLRIAMVMVYRSVLRSQRNWMSSQQVVADIISLSSNAFADIDPAPLRIEIVGDQMVAWFANDVDAVTFRLRLAV